MVDVAVSKRLRVDCVLVRLCQKFSTVLPNRRLLLGLCSVLRRLGGGRAAAPLLLAGGCLLLTTAALPSSARAQPDSIRAAILEERGLPPDHTPASGCRPPPSPRPPAPWYSGPARALALPGWGQFYNRQYIKIPFVVAGLGGMVAAIVTTNNNLLLYRHAALYRLSEERGADPNEYPQYQDEYQQVRNRIGGAVSSAALRRERDRFRRLRDLSVIGLGLYYGLTVVDAYVSAHLLTFDVGDDLSMQVAPTHDGVSATVQMRF